MEKIVRKVQFIHVSDRYIYYAMNEKNEIVELNFMQGQGEHSFKKCQENNPKLVVFYHALKSMEIFRNYAMIDKIDEIFWMWVSLNTKNIL